MRPTLRPSLILPLVAVIAGCGPGPTANPPGPLDDIELVTDKLGVTHVYAKSDRDALFGAGYAQARDRLFQMEIYRRRAQGRLAEAFGDVGLKDDRKARVMGFARLGLADAALIRAEAPDDAKLLEAWTAGVNARIDEIKQGKAPVPWGFRDTEFGFLPDPWTTEDAMGVGKLLAFGLSSTLDFDLLASVLGNVARDPATRYGLLRPAYEDAIVADPPAQGGNARGADPGSSSARAPGPEHLPAAWERVIAPMDSNNWAVDGAHSANGRPLLCGDPHQPLTSPQNFWPVHLASAAAGGTLDVIGFGFVGTPLVELGHNARVGWTATTSFADVTDIWDVEAAADHVTLAGVDRPMTVRSEIIRVRRAGRPYGEADEVAQEVDEVPGFGVLLPAEILPVPPSFIARHEILFNWTGFRATREALAYLGFDRAKSLDDFERAVDRLEVGAQNFVAADARAIAHRVHALVPDRGDPKSHPMPWHILAASDEKSLWADRWLAGDKLPHLRDPKKGWIASANNDPFGFTFDGSVENDPFYFGAFYAIGFRAHRINEALAAMLQSNKRVSRDDMVKLQDDTHSAMADTLLPRLEAALAALDTDDKLAAFRPRAAELRALGKRLAAWDRRMTRDAEEPLLFVALEWFAAKRAFSDKLGPAMFAAVSTSPPYLLGGLRNLVEGRTADPAFFAPDGTAPILVAALVDAADWKALRFPDQGLRPPFYGDFNFAVWNNSYAPGLVPPPTSVDGASDTVKVSEARFFDDAGAPLARLSSREISLYRMALQFGDDNVPEALVTFARGASGEPGDAHFADQEAAWVQGAPQPLPFRRADVEAAAVSRITLPAARPR